MKTTQRCRLANLNRVLIGTMTISSLLMDGIQAADFPCAVALVLWLWLPQYARAELRLLSYLERRAGRDIAQHDRVRFPSHSPSMN